MEENLYLVTDHKPLLALFGPSKATPMLAANRLARWALTLSQYDYEIEYRSTNKYGNADALNRLPFGPDVDFDKEEGEDSVQMVSTINYISKQLKPKDSIISASMKYTRTGWPEQISHCSRERVFRRRLQKDLRFTVCGKWLSFLWYSYSSSKNSKARSVENSTLGALWYAENEAVGTLISI